MHLLYKFDKKTSLKIINVSSNRIWPDNIVDMIEHKSFNDLFFDTKSWQNVMDFFFHFLLSHVLFSVLFMQRYYISPILLQLKDLLPSSIDAMRLFKSDLLLKLMIQMLRLKRFFPSWTLVETAPNNFVSYYVEIGCKSLQNEQLYFIPPVTWIHFPCKGERSRVIC